MYSFPFSDYLFINVFRDCSDYFSASPAILTQNIDILIKFGLEAALQNTPNGVVSQFGLAKDTLNILLKLAKQDGSTKPGGGGKAKDGEKADGEAAKAKNKKIVKYALDHAMLVAVERLLTYGFFVDDDMMYAPMATVAVELIYAVSATIGSKRFSYFFFFLKLILKESSMSHW